MITLKQIDKNQIKTINYSGLDEVDKLTLNKILTNLLITNGFRALSDIFIVDNQVDIEGIKEYTQNFFEMNLQKIKNLFKANKEDFNVIKYKGVHNTQNNRNSNNTMTTKNTSTNTDTIRDNTTNTKDLTNEKTWTKTGSENRSLNNTENYDKGEYGTPTKLPMEYDKQTSNGTDNLEHNVNVRDNDRLNDRNTTDKTVNISKEDSSTNETKNTWEATVGEDKNYDNTTQDMSNYIKNILDIANNTLFKNWIDKLILNWYWLEN